MIPNVIHFIFGLTPDFGGKPFSLVHYLAIRSAYVVNTPTQMNLYCKYEPSGEWWERARQYVNLIPVDPPDDVFGIRLNHYAHKSDVLRLQILLEEGGIYLDMDVICVRSFAPLLGHPFVMGRQGLEGGTEKHVGLCNAVILAEENSSFGRKWLEGFDPRASLWHGFRSTGWDDYWDEMSVRYPAFLATLYPHHICVQDERKFFWPLFYRDHLDRLFKGLGGMSEGSYCHHLWESISWDRYLKDLTVDYVQSVDTNFNCMVRPFLRQ